MEMFGLSFGFQRAVPSVLQSEAAECGLACLCALAASFGQRTDLAALRQRFSISQKGTSLATMIEFAMQMGMSTRPVRLDIESLEDLKIPCVVHWKMNHFVVLTRVARGSVVIMDPAVGETTISMTEFSKSFTGVALEIWPSPKFAKGDKRASPKLRDLLGQVRGLVPSLLKVLVMALALECLALLSPLYLQWVIDGVVVSADRDLLATLAIGFALALLAQALISAARSWALMRVGAILSTQWRGSVFLHLLRLPVKYFESRHLGDVVSRFGAVEKIQAGITTTFVESLLDGVMVCATLVVMLVYDPVLTLVAVSAAAAYGIVRTAWYHSLLAANSSQIVFNARQQTHFLESIRGIRSVKLFGVEKQRHSTWMGIVSDEVNANLRTQRLTIVFTCVHSILSSLEHILIIYFGARFIIDGQFSVGALTAFNAYRMHFDERVNSFTEKVVQLRLLRLQAERLMDIAGSATEPSASSQHLQTDPVASIGISSLWFRYADDEPYIVSDVNFAIEPQSIVSLSGASGCGKSTIMSLILGVNRPTSGEVRVGDVLVSPSSAAWLRQYMGTVMQDESLFSGSVASNICFGDPRADLRWAEECAKVAHIHKDIADMPMGYATHIGDMGTVLSGGQKQRLLLARALYKKPRLLLLDEATGHLDVLRERQVLLALRQLRLTILIVAHRPETISLTDRCLTLEGGRIVRDERRRQAG